MNATPSSLRALRPGLLRWAGGAGLALGLSVLTPGSAWACAACYGASDSPMAQGMNWGIFVLLGMIGLVLAGVASFFIYLARKSARLAAEAAMAKSLEESTQRI